MVEDDILIKKYRAKNKKQIQKVMEREFYDRYSH
jgi:hypothetical protein